MERKIIAAFAGIAMLAGLPGYALAGWMDNVPSRFLPQTHQASRTAPRHLEAADAGLTTGSIAPLPRRPTGRQPARPVQDF